MDIASTKKPNTKVSNVNDDSYNRENINTTRTFLWFGISRDNSKYLDDRTGSGR